MPRLTYLIKESGDPALRLNALWAVKNLIRKTSTETKRDLMSHLGWQDLLRYLICYMFILKLNYFFKLPQRS